jgi:hypothetical protein
MQIAIAPTKEGRWNWLRVDEKGKIEGEGPGFEDRASAVTAGRIEGGAEEVTVTRGSGVPETYFTPPSCRVVLLRQDGSEVGELDPAPGDGEVGQRITLTPVGSNEEAVTNV